jgi:PBP1b-binding outer membrane lipoprotein LpoB
MRTIYKVKSILIALFTVIFISSCTTVKEYQKNKLNDAEMILSNRKIEKSELSFQSYREGASGANSGKSGGGCGCN